MSIETLKENAKTYSISQEYLDSKEKGRLEFIKKFPIEKISELSLDEFVLGTNKDSFCYWLEYKKIEDKVILFGIGGGDASKHGLYKSKDGSYQIGFRKNKKTINGKELEEYFSSIKSSISLAIQYISENKISEIKKMIIPFTNIVLLKILSIYYPHKFIMIGASRFLIDLANDINLQNVELTPNNLIEINYECKKAIDEIPELKNWSYVKTGEFVWNYYHNFENFVSSNMLNKNNIKMNFPLNSILYGPPGTGKTYNTIDQAVTIATGASSDHNSNKKLFDELRKQGQIEFVTFHQNYSYEDFMVGIRPNVSETTNELSFKKHYGIFYEIAKRARENYENSLKDEQTISKENWVNEKFEEFKEYVETEIEENGRFVVKNNVSIYSVEDEVFIYTGEKGNGEFWKNHRIGMHYDALINMYLANVESRKDIQSLDNVPALEKQHATYSFELVEKFREFLKNRSYWFQNMTVKKEPLKNFVLIIDEINRANISKVFGELITLLEDDKRLGEPNELKITLPNGEKEFGVPPNLYLIGTMNTADKSIALIDIALRRRFEFLGYYPNYDNLETAAKVLLQAINSKIYELKKSSDYLIGHAYFMKDQDIEMTLRNKVVPLLMEYFSGKTDIVSKIFSETSWQVEYNINTFDWTISQR